MACMGVRGACMASASHAWHAWGSGVHAWHPGQGCMRGMHGGPGACMACMGFHGGACVKVGRVKLMHEFMHLMPCVN